jgi:uncharacterized protein YukE
MGRTNAIALTDRMRTVVAALTEGSTTEPMTAKGSTRVRPNPEDAYSLQDEAEKWQTLATRQQELAMQLRQLASDQRELVALWDAGGVDSYTQNARAIEEALRELSKQVITLEIKALERVTTAIEEETKAAKALRPDSR